jgi:hypothetical protein
LTKTSFPVTIITQLDNKNKRKNKKYMNKLKNILLMAAIAGFGLATVNAQPIVTNQVNTIVKLKATQSGTTGCPGKYYGFVALTNPVGSVVWTPPVNTTTATVKDISNYSSPYSATFAVIRLSDFNTWCGSSPLTFPAVSTDSYEIDYYVNNTNSATKNPVPVTNSIVWSH